MSDQEQTYGDPRVQRFHAYWRAKCSDGRLPGRADIDPLDIPDLLPGIVLMDVAREKKRLRFRVRLAGTMVCNVHRRDITGEWVEDMIGT
ncbi:MAG: PAS domain-containing protein, partial [Pseudomonadota bacterium]